VFSTVVAPGDEVLIPDPGFASYTVMVPLHAALAVPYALRASAGFVPDPDEIARLVTPRTKLIVINSPGNPTGAVFPQDVVQALVRIAQKNDITLIYDELIFDGFAANAAKYDPEHVVGVYSFSKTYAMTGWRVGYIACDRELAQVLAKVQVPLISCVSAVSQAAALAALTGPQDCVTEMRDAYRTRRDLVVRLLTDAGIRVRVPQGAFYLMFPLASGVDSRRAALDLVEHGVAVAPGSAFGRVAADCLRISLAASEATLREGIDRILAWYRKTDGGAALSKSH
jgi:aspartate/methionine/tyrosine aminotransferase